MQSVSTSLYCYAPFFVIYLSPAKCQPFGNVRANDVWLIIMHLHVRIMQYAVYMSVYIIICVYTIHCTVYTIQYTVYTML